MHILESSLQGSTYLIRKVGIEFPDKGQNRSEVSGQKRANKQELSDF